MERERGRKSVVNQGQVLSEYYQCHQMHWQLSHQAIKRLDGNQLIRGE